MSATLAAACCCADALYATGPLSVARGLPATNFARWSGSAWTGIDVGPVDGDAGADGEILAMAVHDSDLYTTGASHRFVADRDSLTPAGVEVNNIARWDGSNWSTLGGIDSGGDGFAILSWNSTLILAGSFSSVDSVSASNIAAWGPSSWAALGDGLSSRVNALGTFDGDLVAGGFFTASGATTARRIARWNGSAWSEIGGGVDDEVHAILEWDDGSRAGNALYIGGEFTSAGVGLAEQTTVNKVARWGRVIFDQGTVEIVDGVVTLAGPEDWPAWAADASLWIGETEYDVDTRDSDTQLTLVDTGVNVSAGTAFELLSDDPHWSDLPAIDTRDVTAMVIHDDELIIARGTFSTVNIYRWTGGGWELIGQPNAIVQVLASFDDELHAGGRFTLIGSTAAKRIARWDGSAWHALGAPGSGGEGGGVGLDFRETVTAGNQPPIVNALAAFNGELHVGGRFHVVAQGTAFREGSPQVARPQWNRVSGGTQSAGLAMVRYANQPVIGGAFTIIGSDADNRRIARLVNSTWSPLAAGLADGRVNALIVFGDDLIAGGTFTGAQGGPSMTRVGRWDGTQWHAMDTGLPFEVHSFAVFNGDLYAGVDTTGHALYRWDGAEWVEVTGPGNPDGPLFAMAVYDGDLYLGNASGTLRKYDGTSTTTITGFFDAPAGATQAIRAMQTWLDPVSETERLIIGGDFTERNDGFGGITPTKAIAQYTTAGGFAVMGDGFTDRGWEDWDDSPDPPIVVRALAVHDGDLIAGGNFTRSGATRTRRVARWNGSAWSEVDVGFNDDVFALLG